jgi:hypothetical protein
MLAGALKICARCSGDCLAAYRIACQAPQRLAADVADLCRPANGGTNDGSAAAHLEGHSNQPYTPVAATTGLRPHGCRLRSEGTVAAQERRGVAWRGVAWRGVAQHADLLGGWLRAAKHTRSVCLLSSPRRAAGGSLLKDYCTYRQVGEVADERDQAAQHRPVRSVRMLRQP